MRIPFTRRDSRTQALTTGLADMDIRVFNAELTFPGGSADPQDDEEDNPGFFMAVGGPRKLLTMSLSPANPHDLMPDGFLHALETRPAPPPYQVSLSGYPHVAFYTQAVGGDPLAETNWGWKETGPNEFTESPAPEQVYVEAVSPGNQNVGFGLNIAAPAELIFWEGAPAEAQDWVKVTAVQVDLDIVGITSEELEDDPGGFIAKNGSRRKIKLSVKPDGVRPVRRRPSDADGLPRRPDPLGLGHLHGGACRPACRGRQRAIRVQPGGVRSAECRR